MLGTVSSQLGVLQLGVILGDSLPPVDEVPLELCCATVESLNPVYSLESLSVSRSVVSLNRQRTLEQICECN